jgi:hypothetical protein
MRINWEKIIAAAIGAALLAAAGLYLKQMIENYPSMDQEDGGMEISDKERYWMNNKLFQFWRFMVLNLKILKAVDHSKRA